MACSGAFATVDEFRAQWFYSFEEDEASEIQPLLTKSAGRIHAAMAATGQCSCNLASWAPDYLSDLNMTLAVVMFNMPCVRISGEQRQLFADQVNEQLNLIRTGEIELCAGETAKQHPAFAVAEIGITDRNIGRIIANRLDRQP